MWKFILHLWACNQSVALKHAIIRQQWNIAKFQNLEKYRSALIFQYYFRVSGNFFPILCLHALLITCISSSFFHFLPFFSSFFWKKLEEIPFFPVSSILPERNLFLPEVSKPWHLENPLGCKSRVTNTTNYYYYFKRETVPLLYFSYPNSSFAIDASANLSPHVLRWPLTPWKSA